MRLSRELVSKYLEFEDFRILFIEDKWSSMKYACVSPFLVFLFQKMSLVILILFSICHRWKFENILCVVHDVISFFLFYCSIQILSLQHRLHPPSLESNLMH